MTESDWNIILWMMVAISVILVFAETISDWVYLLYKKGRQLMGWLFNRQEIKGAQNLPLLINGRMEEVHGRITLDDELVQHLLDGQTFTVSVQLTGRGRDEPPRVTAISFVPLPAVPRG